MKQPVMQRTIVLVVLALFCAATAEAGREWAPRLDGVKRERKGPGSESSIWLRFAPGTGTYEQSYIDYWRDTEDGLTPRLVDFDVRMVGVNLEAAFRPLKARPTAPTQWALEVQIPAGVYQSEFDFDFFQVSLQLIPAGRLIVPMKSGMSFSPYVGFGGGAILHIDDPGDNLFDRQLSLRLGADLMLSRALGVGLSYTRTSISYSSDEAEDWADVEETADFDLINLSFILHP